ncbi:Asp-tRNA(Asn)/Glu-tRNA(Gln) amidotransferase subunit GatB [Acidiferrobacter sp.]|jgi:aspartyl-tRNA(Asn)/glutamyl-tRNA(Gln) amidotransferase subunit B|uniref:Asp-tRNA(Asn)/Glu-tRNA(Gln) amidotransferase subunit GatB n=1 Tax=Acidiferrobacter sp. TaxID=1872107 RepID=UPI0026019946|nr:Asp-tRNA(Asn)/Glu-tRNA(Gln) amidotransferase subunit GatB [Acidiferrobacter sp.]
MEWETVIGLEVHAQLKTRSKIFSASPTAYGAAPNTQANVVDAAFPGVLPVLNGEVVRMAARFGLAIGATVHTRSVFARKNYFYPDLPKGYQISQYEHPIVERGRLVITTPAGEKTIGITRAHLEEDAGKSLHEDMDGFTGIDLNRAGTPLLEIVSEPDMRSAAEAVAYLKTLHTLVRYLDICDGNMQEGSFRCDANVSVRPFGQARFGTRAELKNINSFRFVERAIDYEVRRQIALLSAGGQVRQETRLYDSARDETRSMRSKEEANDYRYFPDPDLPALVLTEAFLAEVKDAMPELPDAKRRRLGAEYGLSAYDAGVLTASRELAQYYEDAVAAAGVDPKLVANWVTGELAARLNEDGLDITNSRVMAPALAGLLRRIADGTVSGKAAKDVFEAMWAGEGDADAVIAARGLRQISDDFAIEEVVRQVIAANPKQLAQYRSGEEKVFTFFVGQTMKASRGKANPAKVNEILKRLLAP